MPQKLFNNEEDDQEKIEESYRELFFYIGLCVTRYQSVEDHLYDTFLSVMNGSNMRAASFFELANSLESKLKMITAATTDCSNDVSDLWIDLRPRIKSAFDQRNLIAHATPITIGRGAVLKKDEQSGEFKILGFLSEHSEFKLEKRRAKMPKSWNFKELRQIHDEFMLAWINQLTFNKIAQGEAIPQHFKEAWQHPVVQNWNVT